MPHKWIKKNIKLPADFWFLTGPYSNFYVDLFYFPSMRFLWTKSYSRVPFLSCIVVINDNATGMYVYIELFYNHFASLETTGQEINIRIWKSTALSVLCVYSCNMHNLCECKCSFSWFDPNTPIKLIRSSANPAYRYLKGNSAYNETGDLGRMMTQKIIIRPNRYLYLVLLKK